MQKLLSWRVLDCFSQEKNFLIISLYNGERFEYIAIRTDSEFASIYLLNRFDKAKRNTIQVFPEIAGEVIRKIRLVSGDRIVVIELSNFILYVQIFGGGNSNVVLTDTTDLIITAFKASKIKQNGIFQVRNVTAKDTSADNKNNSPIAQLEAINKHIGAVYFSEFRQRCRTKGIIDYNEHNFTVESEDVIQALFFEFTKELRASNHFYLYKAENQAGCLLSLIPLCCYGVIIKDGRDINELLRHRIAYSFKEKRFKQAYNSLKLLLMAENERNNKKIADIEKHKNEDIEGKCRLAADLLAMQPNQRQRVGDVIELEDWSGSKINIKLDPLKTILENSVLYYEKARKAKAKRKRADILYPRLLVYRSRFNDAISALEAASTFEEIENIKNNITDTIGIKMEKAKSATEAKSARFKHFELGEGYELFVGKSAANNDELTMGFAKPNDLWFHARGSSGSHAVMPLGKTQKPPKKIIEKAAAIAAYYSGARNAKYVPVCYTQKKYVRKPKGANPGSVVIAREEVVMVEPKLPEEAIIE
jgi:predicted ribosome quality control (RQC) complex YloA/Tae2 family protein